MGYYTNYSLEFEPTTGSGSFPNCKHDKPEDAVYCPTCGKPVGEIGLEEALMEWGNKNEIEGYNIAQLIDGDWDSVKWYQHQDHMRELSKAFPNVLFTLSGEGEEGGDIWKEYYLNGKVQVAKARIEFDLFDESKLE